MTTNRKSTTSTACSKWGDEQLAHGGASEITVRGQHSLDVRTEPSAPREPHGSNSEPADATAGRRIDSPCGDRSCIFHCIGYIHRTLKISEIVKSLEIRAVDRPDMLAERTADQWQQDAFGQVDAWLSALELR